MDETQTARDLLVVDLALSMGLASPAQAAAALQCQWADQAGGGGQQVLDHLIVLASISPDEALALQDAVQDAISAAGGDPKSALTSRRPGADDREAAGLPERAASLTEQYFNVTPTTGTSTDVEPKGAASVEGGGSLAVSQLRPLGRDRYAGFETLAKGGMGVVYLALDTDLSRQVALKMVKPLSPVAEGEPESGPLDLSPPAAGEWQSRAFRELSTRLLEEAWITGGLEHPGVVPVYEVGRTPTGIPYYTMRLVRGERTLSVAIKEAISLESRIALLEPFLKVCDTLRYAHSKGVIHRDLKPSNVALGEFGEVVVLDWGVAKVKQHDDLPGTVWTARIHATREVAEFETSAKVLGTAGYIPPEMFEVEGATPDELTDVFALGVILYQILTGSRPYEFRSFAEYIPAVCEAPAPRAAWAEPGIPHELDEICARTLKRDPAERTPSAGALAESIRTWQRRSAVEREADGLVAQAREALAFAGNADGEAMARHLDQAAGLVARVRTLVPEHAEAATLAARINGLRESAIEARVRAVRRGVLRRSAVATVLLAGVGSTLGAWVLSEQVREAREARNLEEVERERAESAEVQIGLELQRARANGLAGASAAVLAEDPALALLLAREAGRIEMLPAVQQALHAALGASSLRAVAGGDLPAIRVAAYDPGGDLIATGHANGRVRLWSADGAPAGRIDTGPDPVDVVVFSPDGSLLLAASDDGAARLWHRSGAEKALLAPGAARATAAGFSPDGRLVALGGGDGVLRVATVEDGTTRVAGTHAGPITAARFASDGSSVLSASTDGTAVVRPLDGGEAVVLGGPGNPVRDAHFLPGGGVVTVSEDGSTRVWSRDGAERARLDGDPAESPSVAVARRGGSIALLRGDRVTLLAPDGAVLGNLDLPQRATAVRFAPDARHLAVIPAAENARTVHVVDGAGRVRATLGGASAAIVDARFSPDGEHILVATADGACGVHAWRGGEAAVVRGPVGDGPVRLAFAPSGDLLAEYGRDDVVRLLRADGTGLRELGGHRSPVTSAVFAPDGYRLAGGAADGALRMWDADGNPLSALPGHGAAVTRLVFAASGEFLLSQDATGEVRTWLPNGIPVGVLPGAGIRADSATFTPGGQRVAALRDDGTVGIWKVAGDPVASLPGHPTGSAILESPDGRHLFTTAPGAGARLWNSDGEEVARFELPDGEDSGCAPVPGAARLVTWPDPVTVWSATGDRVARIAVESRVIGVSPAPHGERLLILGDDGTARIMGVDGRVRAELDVDPGPCRGAFSRDGTLLQTAGAAGGSLRIWNARGHLLATLRGGDGTDLLDVAFAPSGDHVAATGTDGVTRVWVTRERTLLAQADCRAVRDFTSVEWERYGELLGALPPRLVARRLVARLRARHPLLADARNAIAAADVDAAVRRAALAAAAGMEDDPERLAGAAWETLRTAGDDPAGIATALRYAEAAASGRRPSAAALAALGVARYRAGRYDEALGALRRADAANVGGRSHPRARDLAFIAMSEQRLGRADAARSAAEAARTAAEGSTDRSVERALAEMTEVLAGIGR